MSALDSGSSLCYSKHTKRMYVEGELEMARNKHPEETTKKILDVSLKLFLGKGYEETTIQDIVDHLGGLSKGAIYHHFKSKEDIFAAIAEMLGGNVDDWLTDVLKDRTKTGLEKLRYMFLRSLTDPNQTYMTKSGINLLKNPKLLTLLIQSLMTVTVPQYIQPVIEEGVRDGSIQTDQPREMAEVVMLLINLWLDPAIYSLADRDAEARLRFADRMLRNAGLPLFDQELWDSVLQYMLHFEEILSNHQSI